MTTVALSEDVNSLLNEFEQKDSKNVNSDDKRAMFIQFEDSEGVQKGNPIYLPIDSNVETLTQTVKSVMDQENDFTEFEFFVDSIQILDDLQTAVKQYRAKVLGADEKSINSLESIVKIRYQAQALFHVRPVTRCSSSIPGHKGAILVAHFSPDGGMLATGSGDATVRFWDLVHELPATLGSDAHYAPVLCVVWSPDGMRLASGCQGGKICIWQPYTASDFEKAAEEVSEESRSRKMVGDMYLKCSFLKPGSTSSVSRTKWIRSLVWQPYHIDPMCRLLAAAYQDSTIVIWDTVLGQATLTLHGHDKPITFLKWGGSNLLYSASQDCSIRVWKPTDGSLVRVLSMHGHWVNCLAVSTDYVLRTGPFDPAKATFIKHNPHYELQSAEAREDLRKQAKALYEKHKGPGCERMASGSDDNTLTLWHPEKDNKPASPRMTGHQGVVNDVKFSPDGRFIASASFDHSVKIWDGFTGAFLATMYGHVQEVYLVAWSGDSRMLVSGSKDSTVKLWSINEVRRWTQEQLTGGKEATLGTGKFKRRPVDAVITADNAIAKKKAKGIPVKRGPFQGKRHLLHDLPGHADAVYAVDWSPDGQRVASGGKDKVLKLWRS